VVIGEARLRQILPAYVAYYNRVRTHLARVKMRPSVGQCSAPIPCGVLAWRPVSLYIVSIQKL